MGFYSFNRHLANPQSALVEHKLSSATPRLPYSTTRWLSTKSTLLLCLMRSTPVPHLRRCRPSHYPPLWSLTNQIGALSPRRRRTTGRSVAFASAAGFGASGRRRLHLAMDWPGTGLHSLGNASAPHAGIDSASSHPDLSRRRFAGKDMPNRHPGSALAQQLVGSPLSFIKCDDCPRQVVRRVSTTPEYPRWVFFKCKKDHDECKFWY